ncbi:MAG: rRNA adenine N-6-methyltransferase family protein [Chloroflexota bacterium]
MVDAPYIVVANVPYYITGAILRQHRWASPATATGRGCPERSCGRLTAEPPNMSLLAVSVQYYGRVNRNSTVKAGAFWPRQVNSAVIRIDVDNTPSAKTRPRSFAWFARGSAKRKQLKNNLKQLADKATIDRALEDAGVDGRRRAERLRWTNGGHWSPPWPISIFNTCYNCGQYHADKAIDPDGPFAVCPECGYRHPFRQLPLLLVGGASGAGKS